MEAAEVVEDVGVLKVISVSLHGRTCWHSLCLSPDVLPWHVQSIQGYTWPGIEYGEAPSCRYSFFQVRLPAAVSEGRCLYGHS